MLPRGEARVIGDARVDELLRRVAALERQKPSGGLWTPTWTGLTVVGAPTYAGRYTCIGGLAFFQVVITAGGANTTASTAGITLINNLPFKAAQYGPVVAGNTNSYGVAVVVIGTKTAYTPTWSATNLTIVISGWYEV